MLFSPCARLRATKVHTSSPFLKKGMDGVEVERGLDAASPARQLSMDRGTSSQADKRSSVFFKLVYST